ncbi:hypothetical protein thsps21_42000 [Pseudomonas sp. No.21]|jgi:PBP1b-binding outer membrane lipoprotein LpoB|uniref:Lipoprotein n=1 Tax=Pseudomonas solani TaxID=2731552 RepID=A0AAU7XX86_9PSED|nr:MULTISPECIES: hypothetical protein [Pseudomonas]EQM66493.1 hypothetical protein L682_26015 [Pseudomonas alcaligenes OT 69]MDN4148352.1 hypothetical protein [Pseudomonas tohonis]MDW3712403.1 hypothetical protein [Pseudomonas sp. 2023EL-01195]PZE14246.1 hypothetical protein DMX10_07015 [Pseudomonas sp. 57B-090624]WCD78297.1 hypothetical protein PI990_20090 [Pseudomonas sp. TUM22785]
MNRLLAIALAATTLILAGCASQPEPRPYTDAEVKQFSLEMLNRAGLPYEDYEKVRSALMNPKVSSASRDYEAAFIRRNEG